MHNITYVLLNKLIEAILLTFNQNIFLYEIFFALFFSYFLDYVSKKRKKNRISKRRKQIWTKVRKFDSTNFNECAIAKLHLKFIPDKVKRVFDFLPVVLTGVYRSWIQAEVSTKKGSPSGNLVTWSFEFPKSTSRQIQIDRPRLFTIHQDGEVNGTRWKFSEITRNL